MKMLWSTRGELLLERIDDVDVKKKKKEYRGSEVC